MGLKKVMIMGGKDGQPMYLKLSKSFFTESPITAKRIKTDPAFESTRRTNQHFARATKGGKLIRRSVIRWMKYCGDSSVSGRLTALLMKVIKEDEANYGDRTIGGGDSSLLVGFQFNSTSPLGVALRSPYTVGVDKKRGTCTITVRGDRSADMVYAPKRATHFKLVSTCAVVDFVGESYSTTDDLSDWFALDEKRIPDIKLKSSFVAGSGSHVFVVLGVQFLEKDGGQQIMVRDGKDNPLAIVGVEVVEQG